MFRTCRVFWKTSLYCVSLLIFFLIYFPLEMKIAVLFFLVAKPRMATTCILS